MSFFIIAAGCKEKMKADRNTDKNLPLSAFRAVFIFLFAQGGLPYRHPLFSVCDRRPLRIRPHNYHFLRLQSRLHQLPDLLSQKLLMLPDHIQVRLLTGCFATKIVQQSSNGSIEVSYVPIFSDISIISCLSIPISGLYTGMEQASSVAARDCIV